MGPVPEALALPVDPVPKSIGERLKRSLEGPEAKPSVTDVHVGSDGIDCCGDAVLTDRFTEKDSEPTSFVEVAGAVCRGARIEQRLRVGG